MSDTLVLPDRLDTAAASGLRELLAERLDATTTLDGRGVRGMGALCGQVLLAATISAREAGGTLALRPSQAMEDDIRLLGLDAMLTLQGKVS